MSTFRVRKPGVASTGRRVVIWTTVGLALAAFVCLLAAGFLTGPASNARPTTPHSVLAMIALTELGIAAAQASFVLFAGLGLASGLASPPCRRRRARDPSGDELGQADARLAEDNRSPLVPQPVALAAPGKV
ncbi:MAG TPA: hypothetical protein VLM11_03625 [Streptosporangiaceae bacterium]|nr:hypothetical protein [Streptosporangiaceae bacterium]